MITVNGLTGAGFAEVRKVKLERPSWAKGAWEGVSHKDLLNKFVGTLAEAGMRTTGGVYALNATKTDLIAAYDLDPLVGERNVGTPNVAIRHSNSGESSMFAYVGLRVWMNNVRLGIPFFKIRVVNRQTIGVDLSSALENVATEIKFRLAEIPDTIRSMKKEGVLGNEEIDHLFLKIGREGILPWSNLGMFDRLLSVELEKLPEVESWTMVKLFALIVSRWNVPFKQLDAIIRFGQLLPGYPVQQETPRRSK